MDNNNFQYSPSHSPAYQALLQAGPRLKPLQQVHAHLIVSGSHRSLPLVTKLLTLACTAGSYLYTRKLFFSISNPDSFLFNFIIKTSTKFHFPLHAVLYYRRMLIAHISPSNYTFTAVIKACADLSALGCGRVVHSQALVCGYSLDLFVQAALVSFYAKCGNLGVAKTVFDKMPERTVIAWNSMISGYEQSGFAEEAIGLFLKMRDFGVDFDSATFVSVLSACSQMGALGLGCWVHDYITNNGLELNVNLGTALINMYARCGNVRKGQEVFDQMNERNVVTWTAMISGYGMHGHGSEALDLFHLMRTRGPPPNDVTFVAVLSACSHAGLVHEGRWAYASMWTDYGVKPGMEHHVCMVDMLGRAGYLKEAFQFIKELYPLKPAPAVWTAMLSACKMHKNFDLGVQVAEHLLAAEPDNPGHYVLLSNIYALAGRMDRVETVRNLMIRKGLKKQVGYSIIEVGQKTHLFSMADKSHPETNAIYQYLDELMRRIKEAGYVPAPELVMHELEEEEREYAVSYHSEKLAITFGILRTKPGMAIRIVKNLRMCEDCHLAIKYISVVAKREIIVRDKLRFHRFKDGSCSCVDYW
ncbi:pentatricopeptide repeat-containing protein At2g33760 [Cornus florida]|uniref:pentatricopeptide repeat-containing protein At2g33760 n=1 Tax=Cornus florida TaxID=4283 RepID=UPI00289D7370|nr:pentatricopeptide repeat-containing protein At2g33760 [Cornus florida]XP_059670906.1 pentatricopeptide repeat-containing protein At2g33760 [Cornus florida]XP_059670911.1 pentatricopeptide repeat-containing protein At2g33760 [Cornus florida]XP_059670918.1 pentatricopeptide repeat-containing protein At2g33760 [Cornus florida]